MASVSSLGCCYEWAKILIGVSLRLALSGLFDSNSRFWSWIMSSVTAYFTRFFSFFSLREWRLVRLLLPVNFFKDALLFFSLIIVRAVFPPFYTSDNLDRESGLADRGDNAFKTTARL